MSTFAVILAAAGKSSRYQDKNYKKPFAPLEGRGVWLHSAEKFLNRKDVPQLILVISAEDQEYFQAKFAGNAAILGVDVVLGGAERADSVQKALERVKPEIEFVAVHDAARPCIANTWVDEIFAVAEKTGAAIPAIPVGNTLKRISGGIITETVSREGLWEAQTPQVFRKDVLLKAYAQRGGFNATDDAQLVERSGHKVSIVPGSTLNIKITTREDWRLAEQALKVLPKPKLNNPAHPFADDNLWR